ncbi:hypothetical protein G6O69_26105 [Pseudenhygromyxa sp. WMMC2535]|uniref:ADYC domain-containing protein n=1 Tax=Pseudenhygromyxa sp. WMMC2535 TaxID=2712867 RepID=UPI001556F31C|nr:ADYC domain-containing protein [Pseudenhygromyxa sp. WMMC2535]NVB41338.1 hypothetical protein [Pseudenhygromyxa sp. WMMC2535]
MTTQKHIFALTVMSAGLLFASACADSDPDAYAEADIDGAEALRSLSMDCPRWRCGYNTAEINGKSLQELHLGDSKNADADAEANAEGVELVGFLPPLGLLFNWSLGVEGDALVARGGLFGGSTLRGAALLGSIIVLRVDGLIVPVVIAGYEEVDSWSEKGEPVAAYALVYADLDQPLLQRSVCKGTLADPLLASVVVLAGERYDLDRKEVIPDQDGWVTFACAGSAAAKMALLGYGPNADFSPGPTSDAPASVDQRQATLKMITADYCGEGHAYTADGTPLEWENQGGSVVPTELPDPDALEAIWTAQGAACLDSPRLADPDEIACELPSCAEFSLDDGEWATYLVD